MNTPFSSVLSCLSVYTFPGDKGVRARWGLGRRSSGGVGYLITIGERSRLGARPCLSEDDSLLGGDILWRPMLRSGDDGCLLLPSGDGGRALGSSGGVLGLLFRSGILRTGDASLLFPGDFIFLSTEFFLSCSEAKRSPFGTCLQYKLKIFEFVFVSMFRKG